MLNYLYCLSFSSTQKFTGHYREAWPISKMSHWLAGCTGWSKFLVLPKFITLIALDTMEMLEILMVGKNESFSQLKL